MSTATQPMAVEPVPRSAPLVLFKDYCELLKVRVTSLVVMTAWAGYFLGAVKSGESSISWTLLHALAGIALLSAGASALNQVIERKEDALMLRTSRRPIPTGRMGGAHAALLGAAIIAAGGAYLILATNPLTGLLGLATAVCYLGAYTPLKKISPISTFIGAFPGAMPPLLGWTAVRGKLEWEAVALFAIVFVWQFPHFHSIAWLYREDYARADIRMLPVVAPDGRSTAREVIAYSIALVPVSLVPYFLHIAGKPYLVGALLLSLGLLWFGIRLARPQLPATSPASKKYARQLLQATVIYLPLLFALMMLTARTA